MNEIICGDAIEEMEKKEEDSVDLFFTDPPYNISDGAVNIGFDWRKDVTQDFGEWDKDIITPLNWVPETRRILSPEAAFVSFYDNQNMEAMFQALRENDLEFRQKFYWCKKNPPPQFVDSKWQTSIEEMVLATPPDENGHSYNDDIGQRRNVIETSLVQGSERYDHPTQKPERVAEEVIKYWSKKGDTVLDPFCGTGTIPYVAAKLGRDFIGIEQDEEYAELAQKRTEKITRSQSAMDW